MDHECEHRCVLNWTMGIAIALTALTGLVLLGLALSWIAPKASADEGAPQEWRGLKVEPENECSPYVESDYDYNRPALLMLRWNSVGSFYSPYDDLVYDTPQDVDVEHRVARHQAHVSGLCGAPKEVRKERGERSSWRQPARRAAGPGRRSAGGVWGRRAAGGRGPRGTC